MEIPQGNVTAYVIILGQQKLKVDSFQIWQYQSIIYSSTTIFYKRTLPVSLSGTRMIWWITFLVSGGNINKRLN